MASPPGWAFLSSLVRRAGEVPVCLVCPENEAAERAASDLRFFLPRSVEVLVFPGLETSPYRGLSPHPEVAARRAVVLSHLARGFSGVLVTSLEGLLTRTPTLQEFEQSCYDVVLGAACDRDELLARLRGLAYTREEPVAQPGEFSFRGYIVDVFSPLEEYPARIEFFGDSVESIRLFDPATQRTIRLATAYRIVPMREALPAPEDVRRWQEAAPEYWKEVRYAERLEELFQFTRHGELFNGFEFLFPLVKPLKGSLLDFLASASPPPAILLAEPELLEETARDLWRSAQAAFQECGEEGHPALPPEAFLFSWPELRGRLAGRFRVLEMSRLALDGPPAPRLELQPIVSYRGRFRELLRDLEEGRRRGLRQVLVMRTRGMRDRLLEILQEYEVAGVGAAENFEQALTMELSVAVGEVQGGFSCPDAGLRVVTEEEIFGPREHRAPPKPSRQESWEVFRSDLRDLQEGDYVVHVEHGIGRFKGLQTVGVGSTSGEFLVLEYAGGGKLYVPVDRLDLVHKYAAGGAPPQLDRLGGASWSKTKARIKKSMQDLAEDLLRLYAQREVAEGHAFSPDDELMAEFEAAFEYEPTPDQQAAIEACKRDMESSRPMDRLICGDVGYGKTEVAMRAAFKAVADGKQVAVLAPTTVLAFQHYRTFSERFAGFPVQIAMLSRFLPRKEQREVVRQVQEGAVDIVIGTHRLLSRDIRFRDLGLVIVDEEQRFGVVQKEKLKRLKTHVDVLTLSATPIPRTLHMALAGIRDLSVIETPPRDRLAIQTVVARFSHHIIRSAIDLELKRAGQVFFVHNSVETIYGMAAKLRQIVPEARIAVAHGQMGEEELERIMLDFVDYRYDVLVCTTIIENGLDIPRANTIIVNRADKFGLSQLYQLRGRVGRSNRRAYAYLLVPDEGSLNPEARKRLAAIREFSELGSGFRLAAMDLEIRGAGNLLGGEQSGHIHAVGFEMYMRLLEEAVRELKGETPREEERPSIELRFQARIPEHYVEEPNTRIWLYKRIAGAGDAGALERLREEIRDRFGPLPRPVELLLRTAHLRIRAELLKLKAIERKGAKIVFRFSEKTPLDVQVAVRMVQENRELALDPDGTLVWRYPSHVKEDEILAGLGHILDRLCHVV
ncbi:MAG: transcription-repair coupling factor [Acidobacteriota bacterium]